MFKTIKYELKKGLCFRKCEIEAKIDKGQSTFLY